MKTFRIIVGVLAILPIGMLVDALIFHPENYGLGTLGELLYPAIGVPILIINMWAWVHPEIIEYFFLGRDKKP